MTGAELSIWLCHHIDFCKYFCDCDSVCPAIIYGGCPHEVAFDMYHIAIDMLKNGILK